MPELKLDNRSDHMGGNCSNKSAIFNNKTKLTKHVQYKITFTGHAQN